MQQIEGKATPTPWTIPLLSAMRQAMPIVFGYIPVGFAYGVLAEKVGISPELAILMSIIVFAGSAQLIAAGLVAAGASPLSIVITTFIVNLRHVLMSAALAPQLRSFSKLQQALFCFELTDETFALHTTRFQQGEQPKAETYGINVIAQTSWVIGTILGVFAGAFIADVRPIGLDYALPAMFIALLVGQIKSTLHLLLAILAGGVSTVLLLAGVDQWNVIGATVACATLGAALETRRNA